MSEGQKGLGEAVPHIVPNDIFTSVRSTNYSLLIIQYSSFTKKDGISRLFL
jgi:hypothetical protein